MSFYSRPLVETIFRIRIGGSSVEDIFYLFLLAYLFSNNHQQILFLRFSCSFGGPSNNGNLSQVTRLHGLPQDHVLSVTYPQHMYVVDWSLLVVYAMLSMPGQRIQDTGSTELSKKFFLKRKLGLEVCKTFS